MVKDICWLVARSADPPRRYAPPLLGGVPAGGDGSARVATSQQTPNTHSDI
ncbi:MAG: hypothetical protein AAGN15_21500 [Cyanobacteria bacterium J06581_3]